MLPLRDDMLVLSPGARVEVDVDAFEEAVAGAQFHGGELLPADRYEPWAVGRREAVSEAHLGLLVDLSTRLDQGGDAGAAIAALGQVVVIDLLHEGAQRGADGAVRRDGSPPARAGAFSAVVRAASARPGGEARPSVRALVSVLLRGDANFDPPDQELPRKAHALPVVRIEPARHNLPIALTSFIGRDRELREVVRLLDRNRLLTLTGAGGSGKTRLALEAATARLGACHDGGWLVEPAGLGDPALVPAATASALGLTLPPRRAVLDGLGAKLSRSQMLLILDNCEHLVAACASLAKHLLGACSPPRILATSRELLRVPGEVTWRVPSLTPPAPGRSVKPSELASYESTVCSVSVRATSPQAFRWARATPARWPRSACGWTGCQSRWSSPLPAWGRSRPLRSRSDWAIASPS